MYVIVHAPTSLFWSGRKWSASFDKSLQFETVEEAQNYIKCNCWYVIEDKLYIAWSAGDGCTFAVLSKYRFFSRETAFPWRCFHDGRCVVASKSIFTALVMAARKDNSYVVDSMGFAVLSLLMMKR